MLQSLTNGLISAINIPYDIVQNVKMAFIILMALAAIAITVVVLMQKGTNDNVGVIAGASDTYYGKHKEKNREGTLKKITLGLFIFITICSIIYAVFALAE